MAYEVRKIIGQDAWETWGVRGTAVQRGLLAPEGAAGYERYDTTFIQEVVGPLLGEALALEAWLGGDFAAVAYNCFAKTVARDLYLSYRIWERLPDRFIAEMTAVRDGGHSNLNRFEELVRDLLVPVLEALDPGVEQDAGRR